MIFYVLPVTAMLEYIVGFKTETAAAIAVFSGMFVIIGGGTAALLALPDDAQKA